MKLATQSASQLAERIAVFLQNVIAPFLEKGQQDANHGGSCSESSGLRHD